MDIWRRRHVNGPKPVAHLRRGRQLHGDVDGHGQRQRWEFADVEDGDGNATASSTTATATAAEPATGRELHVKLQRAGVQLHQYEQ